MEDACKEEAAEEEYVRRKPESVQCKSIPFDVAFHQREERLAVGLVSGAVEVHKYSLEQNFRTMRLKPHAGACRAIVLEGDTLYSGSSDQSVAVTDLDQGATVRTWAEAHEAPINCMRQYDVDMLVTGDDDGKLKIWDTRQDKRVIASFKEHTDFLTDFLCVPWKNTLVAVSGDGLVSVYDVRQRKMYAVSDNQDDELLSIAMVKSGKKVVIGTQAGTLLVFRWDRWGDSHDRIPLSSYMPGGSKNMPYLTGLDMPLDCLLPVNDDTVLCGCADGRLRSVDILPTAVNTIGEHARCIPFEAIALSHDKRFLASAADDQVIKFWSVGHLFQSPFSLKDMPTEATAEKDRDDGPPASGDEAGKRQGGELVKPAPKKRKKKGNFFSGL